MDKQTLLATSIKASFADKCVDIKVLELSRCWSDTVFGI